MRIVLFFAVLLFAVCELRADQQTREVQEALKEQGFYYGATDGQPGTETTAAIRRYQIRNGLEVNGKLTAETLNSLKVTGESAPPAITSVPRNNPPAPQSDSGSESDLRAPTADRRTVESDRSFLNRNTPASPPPAQRSVVAPPQDFDDESETEEPPAALDRAVHVDERSLFARTPYANAPREVRTQALLRIQRHLAEEGFYRGPIDGLSGPGMENAILSYQADAGLPRTGRLDVATLNEMKMLPGRGGPFPARRRTAREPGRRVYRGIWIR